MRKAILLVGLLMNIICCDAQTYFTGWDNTSEQAGWTEYELGASSTINDWDYEMNSTISAPNQLVHYYPVGGTSVTDDWFVSPAFNFSAGGSIDSLMYKFLGFGTPMAGDTIAIYLLNGSPDPNLATRQLLKIYQGADYQNDDTWRLESNLSIPAISGNSYIAFRYKTTVNWLDTKFDNLKVSYNFPASVRGNSKLKEEVTFYPNPTKGMVKVNVASGVKLESFSLYDIQGKKVLTKLEKGGFSTATLRKGFYVLSVMTNYGLFIDQLVVQ